MEDFSFDKIKNGLSIDEVKENIKKWGDNSLSTKKQKSFSRVYLDTFKNIWIIILCIAFLLSIALSVISIFVKSLNLESDPIELVSIAAAIILSTLFSAISEYKNTTRSNALSAEHSKSTAKVIRSGSLECIPSQNIVMHDLIFLQTGDKVPCDCLLVNGFVSVNQAPLNGESRDEAKVSVTSLKDTESTDYSCTGKLFAGSVLTSGEGYALAVVLGDKTELGKINLSLSETNDTRKDASTLKLEKVASSIGRFALFTAVLCAVMSVVLKVMQNGSTFIGLNILSYIAEAIMLAAGVVIMAVPEGLPMTQALVESMMSEKMYKSNILVSHKSSFSDSAYINLLFSDKTGTITKGILELVEFIDGSGRILKTISTPEFIQSLVLNNDAKISHNTAVGSNNMDRAILNWTLTNNFNPQGVDSSVIKSKECFNSEKKSATVTLNDGTILYKGAVENIIDKINFYTDNGDKKEFTEFNKQELKNTMHIQMRRSMKLLAIARLIGGVYILDAILCLRDEVRQSAADTVDVLLKSGIQVTMVTGDGKDTAEAIAKEAGIIITDKREVVLTHEELDNLSDEEVCKIIPHLAVVARAKPLDKKRLVRLAQKSGYVCAMTGDGVNDAPALKASDVGFSLGDGTAVAQEAGDVVILNNSLDSIKESILASRTMSKSIGKFLIFQLTVNVAALVLNIIIPLIFRVQPFNVIQILWINLIMDTLAGIAFAREPILERYMKEQPKRREDPILTPYIKLSIFSSALFISIASVIVLSLGKSSSFMFAVFVYSIILNSFNTRGEKLNIFERITSNKGFVIVMGLIALFQTFILRYAHGVFRTSPLDWKELAVSFLIALLIVPFDMLKKIIYNNVVKKRKSK